MQGKQRSGQGQLFQARLDQIIDLEHGLCVLAGEIDWAYFEEEFGPYYAETLGRPGKPIRLLVGIHYLKHAYNESDESACERLLENPYWQYFCGFEYFQHELPLDPTTLVKWRKRVGPDGVEKLLKGSIEAAKQRRLIDKTEMRRVNVDTTVQEKAIAYPTDARLYHKMRERLVQAASDRVIELRQSYKRVGKRALVKQGRYAHAEQMKRARRETKKLKTYLGRVLRDIERKVTRPDRDLADMLQTAKRLMEQERDSKNKLYSIDAPEVVCIAKGKAHKRYEFGCKVSLVTTSRNSWIVGIAALSGNPYDGHTLKAALAQAERLTGEQAETAYCDRGYRGHGYQGPTQIHIAGQGQKAVSRTEQLYRKRRSAIEPVNGHLKHDCRMARNYLKGETGDKINALLPAPATICANC